MGNVVFWELDPHKRQNVSVSGALRFTIISKSVSSSFTKYHWCVLSNLNVLETDD